MMGSPTYYDVLFDDGPGDVVFHDCMWSGICTCCIQLLHQDSYYQYANESPDLKVEDLNCRTQQTTPVDANLDPRLIRLTGCGAGTGTNGAQAANIQQHHHHQSNNSSATTNHCNGTTTQHQLEQHQISSNHTLDSSNNYHQLHHHHHLNNSGIGNHISTKLAALNTPTALASNLTSISSSITKTSSLAATALNQSVSTTHASCPDIINSSSLTSPDPTNPSPNSTSPDTNLSSSNSSSSASNSASPRPIRRREHNDSERKRRDHLRNAFNFLRDQVPRFKAISKKPPRIQILSEATNYVQIIIRESQELERRLAEERAKHERLQQQQHH